ncbi:MAG: DUF5312 domain-containing protein [Treponema sp.]|jgi:hypothetical protein|nr:DUF5312 domain-containing protein [Treponema sp.]
MDNENTFKNLARELSPAEREHLLEKIRGQLSLNQEPLYVDKKFLVIEAEREYAKLPWYYRIIFFILSAFSGKSPLTIFQEVETSKLGRIIAAQAPGIYSYSKNLLLPEFYKALADLKESARFFFNALDLSVSRDRGAFYVFLGSLEMENIHKSLVSETDPITLAEKNSGLSPLELRRIAWQKIEDAINLIDGVQRKIMYEDIRFLYCLKQLASFMFDRVILAFSRNTAIGGMTCPALAVRELLSRLNNILFSFREIPSMSLFEALFVFMLQEKMSEKEFDVNTESGKLLAGAERSLEAIRKFNKTTPLTLIVRCASRDPSLSPVLISGGEDWLAVYREHWKNLVKDRFNRYMRTTRYMELQESFRSFFKGINLKILENAESETNPDGIPVNEALSLSFLRTYHAAVFTEDNAAALNAILIDGEFYNQDNQLDFSSSYNTLSKLEEAVNMFEHRISPSGDLGLRYAAAKKELASPALKRRKSHGVIEETDAAALQIIEQSKAALAAMINVLNGIMEKEPVSKYDALINFSKLAGKGSAFTSSLSTAAQNALTALTILEEISVLEAEIFD